MKIAMGTLSLLVLAACGKGDSGNSSSSSPSGSGVSWKASTPREAFDSMKACAEKKDAESMWKNGFTKESKETMLKNMGELIEQMKKAPDLKERMTKDANLTKDPTTMTPEEFTLALFKSELENDPEESTFISVEEKGDTATMKVKEKKTKSGREREDVKNLRKEDGMWKFELK